MCGIAGIFSSEKLNPKSEMFSSHSPLKLLRHRGPDQQNSTLANHFALFNTRLMVQDSSSAADLPFQIEAHGIWVAYNGEISNFQELARTHKLAQKYVLRSKSDTEVIALLYLELGIEFLESLSGMFSIAIVDSRKGVAYLVRDFFGITPLFYREFDSSVQFSSELKVLRYWSESKPTVDRQSVYDLLTLGYIPQTATPYSEIRELDKGHFLEFDLATGRRSLTKYYQLKYCENLSISERDASQAIFELFENSVRRNLVCEAPVGLTLSGGIDTSSILAMVHRLGKTDGMNTFSIRVDESTFDESKFQRLMSARTGSQHHEVLFTAKDVAENVVRHIAYMDEPSANGATLPSFILSREASKHVKVLLSGEGGDEIFNAYETHLAAVVRKYYRCLPASVRKVAGWSARRLPLSLDKLSFDFKAKRFVEGAELPLAAAHIFWRHGFREQNIRALVLGGDKMRSTYDLFEELDSRNESYSQLNRISCLDLDQYLYGDLMVKNDRMMMAHSVESRFPFLDRPLVEYMATVPGNLRLSRFRPRYIQKRAMAEILPGEILRRRSFGLELPHSKWLLGPLRFLVDEYLSKKSVVRSGLFDPDVVARVWSEHERREVDHGRGLWTLIVCQIWHQLFIESEGYLEHLA